MTRRGLQITLGVLWLIDASLQFQPYMFTTRFATDVIAPTANGQASFVSVPVDHVAHLVGGHPVVFNAAFGSLQLAIGVGLLLRRAVVPALAASIVWSLAVWYLAEGMGGLTGTNAALLTGAPGAALLYAVLAAGAWPDDANNGDQRPKSWLAFAWAGYWIGGAILQVWHGPRTGPELAATVAEGANGAPGWLSRFDFSLARNVEHVSPALIDGFIVLEVLIGLAVFVPARSRQIAVVLGSAICCGYWIIGPGFSQLVSGHATDPNTAPLVVVLALAVAGASRPTMGNEVAWRRSRDRRTAMGSYFQVGRSSRSFSTALVVATLLIAAALTVGAGQIKSGSIERAYRHTQYATGSVVSVGENRIAKIRYLWEGKPRMGELDVSAATGVDSGDRLGLRVSDGGRRLQLETPFYAAVYTWTAVALALIAFVVMLSSWRSSAGLSAEGKRWLPAELTRPRRRQRAN